MKKDTIYVDAEDEISAVADSVANSKAKVVALVLPKRCTMLHSAVNMKILNKAAKNASKQIVLITNEQALLPIAAASGLYVAKTLSSKPAVPKLAAASEAAGEVSANLDEEPAIDPTKPIGELAGDDAIEIDDSKTDKEPKKEEKSKEAKNKKLKVPNFDSFRAKLFLGLGGLLLLLILWYVAAFVLPKAEIVIVSDSQEIPVTIGITASSEFTEDNIDDKTFAIETKSIEKSESKTADTTGTKNIGNKATGLLTITNCESTSAITVPKGTVVTASGPSGYQFVTDESVSVPGSGAGPGFVCDQTGKADVNITASEPGGQYNISSRSYSIGGNLGKITGFGGAMSGGTDEEVKVVAASDCDALKGSLLSESNSDEIKQQLIAEFEQEGLSASLDTYKAETVSSTCEPAVGQTADKVTAKATFKYTLSGVSSDSLAQLITKEAQQIAGEDQTIIDTGLSKANISVDEQTGGVYELTVKTTAVTGVKQDENRIKDLVKGKNARETSDTIKQINGVSEVKINYNPFWVNKTPTNPDKITIVFSNQQDGQ